MALIAPGAAGDAATLLLIAALSGAAEDAGAPKITLQASPSDPQFGSVTLTGLDEQILAALRRATPDRRAWSRLFPIYTASSLEAAEGLPPVLGDWSVEANAIRFVPRFPFVGGLRYTARFDGSRLDAIVDGNTLITAPSVTLVFRMPDAPAQPATRVLEVYPSGDELPQNLLRLYVHFSAPMRTRDVRRYVHLYDAKGGEVPLPFVEIPQGLWDPSQRRLTLFFHPGRVKRGVGPGEAMGAPLAVGHRYRFVVERDFTDATGRPLGATYEKRFRVVDADRTSPDPDSWNVRAPTTPEDALEIEFPEPLDHALLRRLIAVRGPDDKIVEGATDIDDGERRWSFTPAAPWSPGEHRLIASPALEDLAGNRLDRLFEEREDDSGEDPETAPIELVRFSVH